MTGLEPKIYVRIIKAFSQMWYADQIGDYMLVLEPEPDYEYVLMPDKKRLIWKHDCQIVTDVNILLGLNYINKTNIKNQSNDRFRTQLPCSKNC